MITLCRPCFNEGRKDQANDPLLVKTKADEELRATEKRFCIICGDSANYNVLEFLDDHWQ